MISLMYPSAKLEMGLARRCIAGWKALRPARSSAPFTKDLVLALTWKMVIHGKIAAATVLLTSFSACLRVSEALKLTWQREALPGELRLAAYPSGTAGINTTPKLLDIPTNFNPLRCQTDTASNFFQN